MDSPGKNTGVGCHAFPQEIFWTQGSNSHLLQIPYRLSHWGSPTPPGTALPPKINHSNSGSAFEGVQVRTIVIAEQRRDRRTRKEQWWDTEQVCRTNLNKVGCQKEVSGKENNEETASVLTRSTPSVPADCRYPCHLFA